MQIGTRVVATSKIDDPVSRVFVSEGTEGIVSHVYYGPAGPSKFLVSFPHGRVAVSAQHPPIKSLDDVVVPKIASVLENTFLTMNSFIRISKENINKQGNIDFLKNVMIGKRKIGEVLAYKILEFILYNEDDLENIKKPKIK